MTSDHQPNCIFIVLPWSPDLRGGVSVVVSQLAKEFNALRVSREIIVSDWSASALTKGVDGHFRFGFSVLGAPTLVGLVRAVYRLPRRLLNTHRLLNDRKVSAINFHYVGFDALGVAVLKFLGAYRGMLVLSFHGTDVRAPRSAIERYLWGFLLSTADSITTCSASLAATLVTAHGSLGSKAIVIHNGVDQKVFYPRFRAESNGLRYLPKRYLVSVGSYIPRKGHLSMLAAFKQIASDHSDLHLVIIGQDGSERAPSLLFAEREGLADRVHCLVDMPPESVAVAVASAIACVQPSIAEPFGIAVIEAGACGTPIIASAVGGHLELLTEGDTGYFFEAGNVDDCARAMRQVLNGPESAATVGNQFRQIVMNRYTWSACATGYAEAAGCK